MGSPAPQNPSTNDNVYQIGGVPVEFPYKPYGSQLAFMGRVISTLDRAQQGRCHALLESPTGTGKTLSLLCSALAWQRNSASRPGRRKSAPTPPDPLVHGGGFIPEPEAPKSSEKLSMRAQRKLIRPTIYYASRTHTQISQVIREYRKTPYRVPMAILASRKHYCTNKHVCKKDNLDEECKLLLKGEEKNCTEYKNQHKVVAHPTLQKGGCNEAHDIEDLVKIGRSVKGCAYFAAQCMAAEADLVFCPYSYVINPAIRKAMDIDIKGAILIFDEAHNIEDMARESGSLDVEEDILFAIQAELGQLCMVENVAETYRPLYDMIQGVISWISQRQSSLEKREFEHYCKCWTGDGAIKELQEAGISQQFFPVLKECATKAIKAASDVELNAVRLSGHAALILSGLFSSLGFLFSDNGRHAFDYQLALQRCVKRDPRDGGNNWVNSMSLWCLNPAVVFREIADLSFSVILSSGTLSPMGSFASELGVQFEACLEAPHVIDIESQLWATVISKGPGDCQLNASYKTSNLYSFQDSLGEALEEIFKIVPGGILVFFPSYKLLEKLRNRWSQTGQWSRLGTEKVLFVEPRNKADDFETVLRGYYNSSRGIEKSSFAIPKKNLKHDACNNSLGSLPVKGGAAFFAVCRGKVSEGIDFSDENARAVVIVGIPFPNINDFQVTLKKNYNDTYKSSRSLLSGSEWYCHQAFRALNQAAGRCIRHRLDYGAIILIDERFKEDRNLAYISRWIKKSIKQSETFDTSLEGLRNFFADKVKQRGMDMTSDKAPVSDIKTGHLKCPSKNKPNMCLSVKMGKLPGQKGRKRKVDHQEKVLKNIQLSKNLEPSDAHLFEEDFIPPKKTGGSCLTGIFDAPFPSPHSKMEDEASTVKIGSPLHSDERVDWELHSTRISCADLCVNMKITFPGDSPTAELTNNVTDSHIDTVEAHSQISLEQPFHAHSMAYSNETMNEVECSLLFNTPETKVHGLSSCTPELKSSLSVNSHHQKHKRLTEMHLRSCALMNFTDSSLEDCRHADYLSGSVQAGSLTECELSSSIMFNKKLHVCCMICRKSLGLSQNNFLVSCSFTSSSKRCLVDILKKGTESNSNLEAISCAEHTCIPVVISASEFVDQSLLKKHHIVNGARNIDIWSELDGCVFRIINCPFCTVNGTCLGVQIVATDLTNLPLLNKIIFFAHGLYIRNEEENTQEVVLNDYFVDISQAKPKNSGDVNLAKSRMKLPRR